MEHLVNPKQDETIESFVQECVDTTAFTDIRLIAGEGHSRKTFFAHSVVLASLCPPIRRVLRDYPWLLSPTPKSDPNDFLTVIFPETKPDTVASILHAMYRNDMETLEDENPEIVSILSALKVQSASLVKPIKLEPLDVAATTSAPKRSSSRQSTISKCDVCGGIFKSASLRDTHMNSHFGQDNAFVCRYCGAGFQTGMLLDKHMMLSHQTVNASKDVLPSHSFDLNDSFTSDGLPEFDEPPESHTIEVDPAMNDEDDEDGDENDLVEIDPEQLISEDFVRVDSHLLTKTIEVDGVMYLQCPECAFTDTSRPRMESHMETVHEEENPFFCAECCMGFGSNGDYIAHIQEEHQTAGPVRCERCGLRFGTKEEKDEHCAVHGEDMEHRCYACHKQFADKSKLIKHIKRVHENTNEFSCRFCNKVFNLKHSLKIHIRAVHENEKSHHCDICGKSFSQRSNLLAHVNYTHNKIGNFECQYCNQKFSRNQHLKRHLKRTWCSKIAQAMQS